MRTKKKANFVVFRARMLAWFRGDPAYPNLPSMGWIREEYRQACVRLDARVHDATCQSWLDAGGD